MGPEPETQGSSRGPASRFRKVWSSERAQSWGPARRGGGVGAKGERAVALPCNSRSSTDFQAADGEEATGTHQCVAGTAQVVAGETLFAPGETQEYGGGGADTFPSLISSNPGCPAMSPFHGSADPETQVREGRHTGAERQVHEKPSELHAR